ncbi:PREDICTED: ribonuclease Z, mitochondrial [Ceratosolen solmsi marchali]|uniref:Zinc phosphodiesterase ELAC protein 2 n=1 Tax=Ceratosolen solmsi marchali TaxID=326594 RepID=A0AAJ6YEY6_9HYME|nr:PREDICTED: ribonuclease Z, mitochondrial [Ceratosolen solmsi marchali]
MSTTNKDYIYTLQKQRSRQKRENLKYKPSRIQLQVIGNGSPSEPRCVMLITDHINYVFNCGEGTQRLAAEHHAKLTKIQHIFITKASWNNIGGILGTSLTIQDAGVPFLNLHGPEIINELFSASQYFINLNKIQIIPANTSLQFNDKTMKVTAISIQNNNEYSNDHKLIDHEFIDNCKHKVNSNGKRSRSPCNQCNYINNIDLKKNADNMLIYICKIHDKTGTLNIEKCVNAGVEPGPNLGLLKSGLDITLPNGKIVKSEEVTSKTERGPLFIVMECPNENWIDTIVQNSILMKYQENSITNKNEIVNVIVHFTPENVLNNSKYIEWMQKFGAETEHLIINEKNTGFSSESIHKMQYKLNLVHPTIFPLFDNHSLNNYSDRNLEDNVYINEIPKSETDKNIELGTSYVKKKIIIHRCKTLNTFSLRPFTGWNSETNVQIEPQTYINEAHDVPEYYKTISDLKLKLNNKEKVIEDVQSYPRLLMLGTGSSIPNKIRNTSGILLQIDEEKSIILDCGEGTVGQIMRFFGESEGYKILKTIKAVYISHLHADHHLGFIGILKHREKVTDEPLFLLAPEQISSFLELYNCKFESINRQYKFINNKAFLQKQEILQSSLSKALYSATGISKISTVFVKHCLFAYGILITLNDGQSICYSGDTMPCNTLLNLAKGCSILIHEATMEDDLEHEATMKRHSTISQAIEVGEKAEVDFILLTHFSQRYSKLPVLPKDKSLESVGIAYDFMIISLKNIKLLPYFYPILDIIFKEFQTTLKARAQRRMVRREYQKEQCMEIYSR